MTVVVVIEHIERKGRKKQCIDCNRNGYQSVILDEQHKISKITRWKQTENETNKTKQKMW